MAKLTFKNSNGTSFHGVRINTTVSKLREIIGDPHFEKNNGKDKVNFTWDCETAEGDVFTIYDWKEYRNISENETIDFHIGGNNKHVCNVAKSELKISTNMSEIMDINELKLELIQRILDIQDESILKQIIKLIEAYDDLQ